MLIMRRLVRLVEWVPLGRWLEKTLQIFHDRDRIVEGAGLEARERVVAPFRIHLEKKPMIVVR